MISPVQIDLLVRGGSIALLALWSWLLLRDHRAALAARLAVLMNASIICHALVSIPGREASPSLFYSVLDTISASVIGLFWLFTKAWFDDIKHVSWRAWSLVSVPPLVVGVLHLLDFQYQETTFAFVSPLIRLSWFAFITGGLWIAWRGRADDLVEARRRLRLQVVVAVGGLALFVNIAEIAVFRFGASSAWRSLAEVGIFFVTFRLSAAMFAHRQSDLFGRSEKTQLQAEKPDTDNPLIPKLLDHMQQELPHRDEKLSIARLAAQLGEQEYRVRRVINSQLGHRNFAAFLNTYRLAEVKSALADPDQKDVPILTIALDAGFGSLGPFNRAFREAEGTTPTEFRANCRRDNLADSEIG